MSFLNSLFSPKEQVQKQNSQNILREILEASRESVLVVNEDLRIVASNRAAYDAFGKNNGSLETKRLTEVIRDLALHEAFQNALQNSETSDVKLEIPGIEKKKYKVHIAPIKLDDKTHAIGFFDDITQIEHLETVRQEFLSNISHELRTPLTVIMAFVETLQDGAIDDKENNQRFLGVIGKNAERMHHLINDILELSSIEAGKIVLHPKKLKLFALVEEVFTNLSTKALVREVKLVNETAKDAKVFADPVRLEQMLTNLIDNAIKFNRHAGTVTVSFKQTDTSDVISVNDTGEGISSEHLQRIFERFYRTDRARSREIGGTGLGLAIVKHLAKLHGGEVSVGSVLTKGTTFSIELPQK